MTEEEAPVVAPVATPEDESGTVATVIVSNEHEVVAVRYSKPTELFMMTPEVALSHARMIAEAAVTLINKRADRSRIIQLKPTVTRPGAGPIRVPLGPLNGSPK